jgi:hypothetical protein
VKWLNKNAYIKIAIDGESFCASCTSVMGLFSRNASKLVAIDFVSTFIILLCKLCVTTICVLMFYGILNSQTASLGITYIYVPLTIIGLVALMVSFAFLSIYDVGIDTIFVCFLEDIEKNDGSLLKPYYVPESIQHILNIHNQHPIVVEDKAGKQVQIVPVKLLSSRPMDEF